MEEGICNYCLEDRPLYSHHESYAPERLVEICLRCHRMIHHVAKLVRANRFEHIIKRMDVSAIENGTEKYRQSSHCKELLASYRKFRKALNFYTPLQDGWALREMLIYNVRSKSISYGCFFQKRLNGILYNSRDGEILFALTKKDLAMMKAQTVATNRAISGLVGGGELSAEEIEGKGD